MVLDSMVHVTLRLVIHSMTPDSMTYVADLAEFLFVVALSKSHTPTA